MNQSEAHPLVKKEKSSLIATTPNLTIAQPLIAEVQKQFNRVAISEKNPDVVVKQEKDMETASVRRTRANKFRAISTPVAKSSHISNISFAQNISAIDFPTPFPASTIVKKRRTSKRKK